MNERGVPYVNGYWQNAEGELHYRHMLSDDGEWVSYVDARAGDRMYYRVVDVETGVATHRSGLLFLHGNELVYADLTPVTDYPLVKCYTVRGHCFADVLRLDELDALAYHRKCKLLLLLDVPC